MTDWMGSEFIGDFHTTQTSFVEQSGSPHPPQGGPQPLLRAEGATPTTHPGSPQQQTSQYLQAGRGVGVEDCPGRGDADAPFGVGSEKPPPTPAAHNREPKPF